MTTTQIKNEIKRLSEDAKREVFNSEIEIKCGDYGTTILWLSDRTPSMKTDKKNVWWYAYVPTNKKEVAMYKKEIVISYAVGDSASARKYFERIPMSDDFMNDIFKYWYKQNF